MCSKKVLIVLLVIVGAAVAEEQDMDDMLEMAAVTWNAVENLITFVFYCQEVGTATACLHVATAAVVLCIVYLMFQPCIDAYADEIGNKKHQRKRTAAHALAATTQRCCR